MNRIFFTGVLLVTAACTRTVVVADDIKSPETLQGVATAVRAYPKSISLLLRQGAVSLPVMAR